MWPNSNQLAQILKFMSPSTQVLTLSEHIAYCLFSNLTNLTSISNSDS